ncbi:MAG: oligoendopeptidase F [Proteobacteria bacterium]|nr:oligoendopeptidase F [Pseudomonadota bacterium]
MNQVIRKTLTLALFTASLALTATVIADEVKEREDIAAEHKWDLSAMYASTEAWEADVKKLQAKTPEMVAFKGRLAQSGDTLLAAINKQEELNQILGNLYVYAGLRSFEDLRISENGAMFARARSLNAELSEATAFFSPELLAIPQDKLKAMVDKTEGLHVYRHYLDEESRLSAYTLSESEEKLLAMASDPLAGFAQVFSALNNADLSYGEMEDEEGNTVELTKARYGVFMESKDRRVRKDAWTGIYKTYEELGNMLAANYDGQVKSRIFFAKARGYDSALHMATYQSAIPIEVYTNLISAVRENPKPLQRYMDLRRETLGLEKLESWDLSAPMVKPVFDDLEWSQAKKIVAEGLAPLGEDYIKLYWSGFDKGWVDAFESRGKRGGAFSWGTYNSKPYLSMNYEGTLNDVSTLAHEYGHSLHSYMTRHTQPYVYGSYRTFIAEIASMTNEALLFQKLLADAKTPVEKAYLLQFYLDQFRGSFFTQAAFADYEMQAHAAVEAGGALTKESLNEIYAGVFADYYGASVNVDPLNASGWSRIPHFLSTNNFYVYQYATSFVAATALAKMILEEGEPARDRFLEMLQSGSNDYPIELLKKAGIDMTSPQPIYDTIGVFDGLIDELEAALANMPK